MAGKAKGIPRDTAVTLRLPRELLERLKEAAGNRSVSEEIRRRLVTSINAEPASAHDPKTKRLLSAIDAVAWGLQASLGFWHENPEAFSAFEAAMDTLLAYFQPAAASPFNERVHDRLTRPGIGPSEAAGIMFANFQLAHGQGGELS